MDATHLKSKQHYAKIFIRAYKERADGERHKVLYYFGELIYPYIKKDGQFKLINALANIDIDFGDTIEEIKDKLRAKAKKMNLYIFETKKECVTDKSYKETDNDLI